MALKRWILTSMNRMNRVNAIVGRPDLVQRDATAKSTGAPREPSLRAGSATRPTGDAGAGHLGAYAPLIAAIRDELEHFVSSHLRLHLAIAERDRYLLTSIEVECVDGGDGEDLLRRFRREFTPEQIKRFLARDVIAHLPNASSIDLSQFGGLDAARAEGDIDDEVAAYADLVAQLRSDMPSDTREFEVTLLGRWTEGEAPAQRAFSPASTPLVAAGPVTITIEDADGAREQTLAAMANRRYAIGKGDGCDVAVKGAFTSRRHCELWFDGRAWWAADAGSTNGVRVESPSGVVGRAGAIAGAGASASIEIPRGACIVLSALAQGPATDYPRISVKQNESVRAPVTPLAPPVRRATTPVTPIAAPRPRAAPLTLNVAMASGVRSVALDARSTPLRVGRSRQQDVVVDWKHEGVSGHHVDIAGVDDEGADVVVHGDNGVDVGERSHRAGERFRLGVGERMTLGRASADEPECTLWLAP